MYIYVIQNDIGYIKIGCTKNFKQRLKSLQNSNSGGHKITRYYCSEETIDNMLEKVMHTIYRDNRVEGEWFKDLNFYQVCAMLKSQMNSEDYKKYVERKTKSPTRKRVAVYSKKTLPPKIDYNKDIEIG